MHVADPAPSMLDAGAGTTDAALVEASQGRMTVVAAAGNNFAGSLQVVGHAPAPHAQRTCVSRLVAGASSGVHGGCLRVRMGMPQGLPTCLPAAMCS